MENKIISDEFVSKYKNKKVNWGFNGLGYIVYKRTYSRQRQDNNFEEWEETIQRCINGAQKIGADYTKEESERLFDYIFNLKCNFAGRSLWQLGTPHIERFGGNSLINCFYFSITKLEDFCSIFENLMMGSGVGFSVRREHIHELPRIKSNVKIAHESTKDAEFIVPDSRFGWIELLRKTLNSYFYTGVGFNYSTILVRGYGEPIKSFGGTASGPQILIEGITNICKVLQSRENKKLRSIDVLDIVNIVGSIVVAGNVRRSSQIALGDADDHLFIHAKRWDLGNIPTWRAMSNNTIVADDFTYLSDKLWEGYSGNGEPYGLFNLPLCQKTGRLGEKIKDNIDGMNPCIPSWSKLLTPNGIKELKDVNIGDIIWSKDGWTQIINKLSSGIKKVNEYRTTAACFYGTENHKLVSNGEKIEARDCESIDILTGEFISEVVLNPQDIMDGLVLGDGSIHKASNNLIHLCVGDNDKDYFNSEIKHLFYEYRPGVGPYAYEIETTLDYKELPLTYNRFVPDRFLYGDRNKKCGFLRGLYSANGSICGNRVTLKAASFKVIEQVQLLLSSIGIKSYYTTNKPSTIEFSNGIYTNRQSYDLNISVDKVKFFKIIGFIQFYKVDKLTSLINNTRPSNKNKSNYDIVIENFISEEEVFDITVDNKSHTFWCNGCDISNCGEIGLESGESCNLAELYLNNIESKKELIDCAKLLYKTQKAICALNYLHKETNETVHRNFRLGLGVTGVCQSLHKLEWLDDCYNQLREFDKDWSKKHNWPISIKLTTLKPSGTLSLLSGSSPGIHSAYSKYYIRRVRMAVDDKLVNYCKELGYKTEFETKFDNSVNRNTIIVEFPCYSGEDVILAKDMSAVRQLDLVKQLQTIWADNSVSCTVYYRKEELPEIKSWLKKNYEDSIKSVSFLLHSEHGFKQPPYEEITEEKYKELKQNIKPIKRLDVNGGILLDSLECANGSCPIK